MSVRDEDESARETGTPPANQLSTDLGALGKTLGSAWSAARQQRLEADRVRALEREAARDAVFASDADRDMVARRLAEAYAQGRLDQPEFNDRTTRALAARTHGELDDALSGLGGLHLQTTQQPSTSPLRKAVFWVSAFCTSPFLFVATLLLLFGHGLEERIWGTVLAVVFLPGILALHRWAWPKQQR